MIHDAEDDVYYEDRDDDNNLLSIPIDPQATTSARRDDTEYGEKELSGYSAHKDEENGRPRATGVKSNRTVMYQEVSQSRSMFIS